MPVYSWYHKVCVQVNKVIVARMKIGLSGHSFHIVGKQHCIVVKGMESGNMYLVFSPKYEIKGETPHCPMP